MPAAHEDGCKLNRKTTDPIFTKSFRLPFSYSLEHIRLKLRLNGKR